ncbi:WD repeat-containing protein 91 [Lamellibrachia satsuma]|nr:WD repeat-containing protein 91 [Lamellibrachia satsuma]
MAPGSAGTQGGCLRDDSVRVKFDTTPSASPQHVTQPRSKDSKSVEARHSSNSSSQSERKSASAQQPGQSSPRSGVHVAADVPNRNSGLQAPFLLLSQEEYVEHHSCVTQCQFCTSGHMVATLDTDGVIKVWTLQPAPVTLVTTMSKTQLISEEWLKKSDCRLLLGSKCNSIRLFDVHEKKTVIEITTDPAYPRIVHLESDVAGRKFVSSAKGGKLGTASQPGTNVPQSAGKLSLWDVETMKAEHHLAPCPKDVAVNSTSFSEDGRLLLAGTTNGTVRLYDTKRRECVSTWSAHVGDIYTVRFSRRGNSCYSMGSDGQFVEWSLGGGNRIMDHAIHAGACGPFVLSGTGGYRQVHTPKGQLFAFSANGQHVLTCAQNGGLIYQFQQQSVHRVKNLGGHSSPVTCVDWAMSSDVNTCVTGSMDGRVMLSTLLSQ